MRTDLALARSLAYVLAFVGTPTVTIGAGQYEVHTVKEHVHLPELANDCRLAVTLATLGG
jgi:hypothetical protein